MITCFSGVAGAARVERARGLASALAPDRTGAATPVAAATPAAFKNFRRPNCGDTVRLSEPSRPSLTITRTSRLTRMQIRRRSLESAGSGSIGPNATERELTQRDYRK